VLDRRMVTMDKIMRLSSTVMEVWRLKDNGVTSLTFLGSRDVMTSVARRGDAVGTAICGVKRKKLKSS